MVGQGRVEAGLHFQLAPGWKTYWRSPGDAGYPMNIDWGASTNLAQAEVHWPAPQRFSLFGIDTFGYEREVLFPLDLVAANPEEPVHLVAEVAYLMCEDICLPYTEQVELLLPPGSASASEPSAEANLIEHFRAQVPRTEGTSGIRVEELGLAGQDEDLRLEVQVSSPMPLSETADMLVEGPEHARFGRPEVLLSDEGTMARFVIPIAAASAIEGENVTLTLVDGNRGLEVTRPLLSSPSASPGKEVAPGLPMMLAIALLGGLVLNLMPCVLPVLSLKVMSLVVHRETALREVRLSFLASSAGILFSFLLIAAGMIALKAGGAAIGWGIQFQQPMFLAFMAIVVTLFAANLFGFLEILLPATLTRRLPARAGNGLAGSFATGAFTTLLATPCSAPFLGTAVAFALSRGAAEILMIFGALGVGLAVPHLAIAAFPRLSRFMPRPGRWMVYLRGLLGLPLVGTAFWLLSVLSVQIGLQAAVLLGLLLTSLLLLFGLRRHLWQQLPAFWPLATSIASMALIVAGLSSPSGTSPLPDQDGVWRQCERERIAEAVAAGQTVVVDVTADWCITCQVNKARVLEDDRIASILQSDDVLAMRADWTRPNDRIADYLSDHGRYGIPFNIVYGPAAPEGIVLPELLRVEDFRDAVLSAR